MGRRESSVIYVLVNHALMVIVIANTAAIFSFWIVAREQHNFNRILF